jgi:hypothetical protein
MIGLDFSEEGNTPWCRIAELATAVRITNSAAVPPCGD